MDIRIVDVVWRCKNRSKKRSQGQTLWAREDLAEAARDNIIKTRSLTRKKNPKNHG